MTPNARARVDRNAARALARLAPHVSLRVAWERGSVADAWDGECIWLGAGHALVVVNEVRFEAATPSDREDTIRHELAHVLAWDRHGSAIAPHGREFLRARAELDDALDSW